MYCKFCGKELPDGSAFCPQCGKGQNEVASSPSVPVQTLSISKLAVYFSHIISILTTPVNFIIRMANQKKRISGEYSWRGEPTYSAYLPDDIKTVITVFFVISTIFGITMFFVLKKKQNKKYWWLIVLSVFNYLLGLFMVMIK